MHVSAYEEACLRNSSSGGGPLGAHQSMPRPLQPHVKLKSVPHCVCVNDPGGTPAPAALHAFPPPHVCSAQGVAQFERITLRNAAEPIF